MEEEKQDEQEVHETPAQEAEEKPEQEQPEEETPESSEDEELTPEQIKELKEKAEVSSQNFERAKKAENKLKDAQERLKELEDSNEPSGNEEDDLRKEIADLKSKVSSFEETSTKEKLVEKYPVLKDKWSDFEEYREEDENQGLKLETAAKAFLAEKDLLGSPSKRKGLEKPTGGPRNPTPSGTISADEAAKLRQNNFKKYTKMLAEGKIKVRD